MNLRRHLLVAGLPVVALTLAFAGCGSDDSGSATSATPAEISFAAPVAGTDAFVGALVNPADRRVLAYLCDGKELGTWFRGQAGTDGNLSLSSDDGAALKGRLDGDNLTGTVTMPADATPRDFSSVAVAAPAGLYRAKGQVGGEPAVGGWIVLENGQERGGVRTSSGFTSTDTDLAKPPKPTTSFTSTDVDF